MRKLPEKFKQVKAKVKIQLNDAAYVCLTTDIWTSRTTEGYIRQRELRFQFTVTA
jgi:hypothetical protein